MRKKLNLICLLAFGIILSSCEKDGAHVSQSEAFGTKRFVLESVQTDKPVDLNFDGNSSKNLFDEIPSLKNSVLFLDRNKERINIIWQEPEFNKKGIGSIPSVYTEGTTVVYYPVQHPYFVTIKDNLIVPTVRQENHNSTLYFPQLIICENEHKLSFLTSLQILTLDGPKIIPIHCTYSKASEE